MGRAKVAEPGRDVGFIDNADGVIQMRRSELYGLYDAMRVVVSQLGLKMSLQLREYGKDRLEHGFNEIPQEIEDD